MDIETSVGQNADFDSKFVELESKIINDIASSA